MGLVLSISPPPHKKKQTEKGEGIGTLIPREGAFPRIRTTGARITT